MEIKRYSCFEGAGKAQGVTLIIDVFRAGNTILSCFKQGAQYVIPVGNLERAYKLKKQNPDYLLAGERNSMPPEGFDFGNSPAEITTKDLSGQTVILTTSAGTQGIVYAGNPSKLLIATFANAKAIVQYIKKIDPQFVSIVAMGLEAREKAEEDEVCAFYIELKLQGIALNFPVIKEKLLEGKGAQRLIGIGKDDDLQYCLQQDTIDIVPEYDFEKGALYAITL